MNCDSVKIIKGIGDKTAGYFANLGIETIDDLVRYYPVRFIPYEKITDISDVRDGQPAACRAVLNGRPHTVRTARLRITECYVSDSSGKLRCVWYNSPYAAMSLHQDTEYVFTGKITEKKGKKILEHPIIYTVENYMALEGHLRPIYGLTKGLSQNTVRKAVETALGLYAFEEDYLPVDIKERYDLIDEQQSVINMHMADSSEIIRKARKRLVFDEFFSFIYSVRKLKDGDRHRASSYVIDGAAAVEDFCTSLPYTLTEPQMKTVQDIMSDMSSGHQMNRLIQGDVGSGKTAVAMAAMYACFRAGLQSAIMAPTEVLAGQHLKTFEKLFSKCEYKPVIVLITGSMKASERKNAYEMIASGKADIIIGTHALIQDKLMFRDLALVVTDEQHRFGVRQREQLSQKGEKSPHILVMSATPIPRTLAVILYGDLDISVIDAKPVGRLPLKNAVVTPDYRPRVYKFIAEELAKGHQAYVICPMIEDSEAIEAENVIDYTEKLRAVYPGNIVIQFLSGRMKQEEKNRVMKDFSEGRINILVSTTVVEVGVDVPNATVMVIENAERFGLATLHQLRGRVGRGTDQSYCIFVRTSDADNAEKRLEVVGSSNDGFYIASEDLRLRGPGEILGVSQSGQMNFGIADIYSDADVLQMANDCCDYTETAEFKPDDDELIRFRKHMEDYRDRTLKGLNI